MFQLAQLFVVVEKIAFENGKISTRAPLFFDFLLFSSFLHDENELLATKNTSLIAKPSSIISGCNVEINNKLWTKLCKHPFFAFLVGFLMGVSGGENFM